MTREMTTRHDAKKDGGVLHLMSNGEKVAHLTYERPGVSNYVIDYVEVKPEHRRQGYAKRLVEEMVAFAEREEADLSATCGVARGILESMGAL